MAQNNLFDPVQSFRLTRIIHGALISGVVIFLVAVIIIGGSGIPEIKNEFSLLNLVSLAALVLIPGAFYFSRMQMRSVQPDWELHIKFSAYQTAMIMRWAMIEAFTLIAIVVLLLEEDGKQFYFALIGLAVLLASGPGRENLRKLARLTDTEFRRIFG